MKVPFSKHNFTSKTFFDVQKVLQSGWLTHGEYTSLFEEEFKKFTNSKYAVTVSSCTAGLHLSCLAAGFKKGDEVIVPAMSHTATSHAVEYTGAKVKFVDVNLITGNINVSLINKLITNKTKGLIVVHMAGFPCDMSEIAKICRKKKLKLIEDCAHGVGTTSNSLHVGNFGISGSFSFYPTKQIVTGEGGIVVTNNKQIFKKIKMLKGFGIDKDITQRKKPGVYDVKDLGFNYRMTDFQSALGYNQIINYKNNLKKRKLIAKRYIKNLKDFKKIHVMPYDENCSYFIFQIFVKNRNLVLENLKKKQIQFSLHYSTPLPFLSFYKKKYVINKEEFKNAKIYADQNISLPCYPKLTIKTVDKICKIIINSFRNT